MSAGLLMIQVSEPRPGAWILKISPEMLAAVTSRCSESGVAPTSKQSLASAGRASDGV